MPELNRPLSRRSRRGGRARNARPGSAAGGAGAGPAGGGLQRALDRLETVGLVEVGAGGLSLCAVLLLGGLVLGASRDPVRTGVWAAAAGFLLIVATGLLYAFRLRASGPR